MTDENVQVSFRVFTEADREAQRQAELQAYRQVDLIQRLRQTHGFSDKDRATLKDAIEEIEWLRAARKGDTITRAERDDQMAEKLREMQAAIAALLQRLG